MPIHRNTTAIGELNCLEWIWPGAGDAVELVGHEQQDISVADITRLYAFDKDDVKSLRQATQIKALRESWQGYFRHQLEKQTEQ